MLQIYKTGAGCFKVKSANRGKKGLIIKILAMFWKTAPLQKPYLKFSKYNNKLRAYLSKESGSSLQWWSDQ
jgi:hypothetical protein